MKAKLLNGVPKSYTMTDSEVEAVLLRHVKKALDDAGYACAVDISFDVKSNGLFNGVYGSVVSAKLTCDEESEIEL